MPTVNTLGRATNLSRNAHWAMNKDLIEVCQIKVRGKLGTRWSDWFSDMTISYEIGGDGLLVTTLTGAVVDQAALYGILWKLRDLNLTLISVETSERDSECRDPSHHERRNPNG